MKNIYARKSQWKWYLAAGAIVIISISLAYTRYVVQRLAEREDQQAAQYATALRTLAATSSDTTQLYVCDLGLQLMILEQNTTIPVVQLNEAWHFMDSRNMGLDTLTDVHPHADAIVQQALLRLGVANLDTIEISSSSDFRNYLIYSHSRLLALLEWYPFVQLFLITAFIAFGYLGFSASRRAEENQVWLGMAKETAHQLGTPITAIIGWIEALKGINEDNESNLMMLDELRTDVSRLELVADRFSKIGAVPELKPVNFYSELEKCRDYMRARAPRRVTFDFPDSTQHPPLTVYVNSHLFDWVVENLLRNAIDAMEEGIGAIHVQVYQEPGWVCADFTDTGKGIPSSKFKTVFKPGYSTKKRGWGLGLSLSKRIVEQYHQGKIFVKRSEPGKATTFTVKLPARQA